MSTNSRFQAQLPSAHSRYDGDTESSPSRQSSTDRQSSASPLLDLLSPFEDRGDSPTPRRNVLASRSEERAPTFASPARELLSPPSERKVLETNPRNLSASLAERQSSPTPPPDLGDLKRHVLKISPLLDALLVPAELEDSMATMINESELSSESQEQQSSFVPSWDRGGFMTPSASSVDGLRSMTHSVDELASSVDQQMSMALLTDVEVSASGSEEYPTFGKAQRKMSVPSARQHRFMSPQLDTSPVDRPTKKLLVDVEVSASELDTSPVDRPTKKLLVDVEVSASELDTSPVDRSTKKLLVDGEVSASELDTSPVDRPTKKLLVDVEVSASELDTSPVDRSTKELLVDVEVSASGSEEHQCSVRSLQSMSVSSAQRQRSVSPQLVTSPLDGPTKELLVDVEVSASGSEEHQCSVRSQQGMSVSSARRQRSMSPQLDTSSVDRPTKAPPTDIEMLLSSSEEHQASAKRQRRVSASSTGARRSKTPPLKMSATCVDRQASVTPLIEADAVVAEMQASMTYQADLLATTDHQLSMIYPQCVIASSVDRLPTVAPLIDVNVLALCSGSQHGVMTSQLSMSTSPVDVHVRNSNLRDVLPSLLDQQDLMTIPIHALASSVDLPCSTEPSFDAPPSGPQDQDSFTSVSTLDVLASCPESQYALSTPTSNVLRSQVQVVTGYTLPVLDVIFSRSKSEDLSPVSELDELLPCQKNLLTTPLDVIASCPEPLNATTPSLHDAIARPSGREQHASTQLRLNPFSFDAETAPTSAASWTKGTLPCLPVQDDTTVKPTNPFYTREHEHTMLSPLNPFAFGTEGGQASSVSPLSALSACAEEPEFQIYASYFTPTHKKQTQMSTPTSDDVLSACPEREAELPSPDFIGWTFVHHETVDTTSSDVLSPCAEKTPTSSMFLLDGRPGQISAASSVDTLRPRPAYHDIAKTQWSPSELSVCSAGKIKGSVDLWDVSDLKHFNTATSPDVCDTANDSRNPSVLSLCTADQIIGTSDVFRGSSDLKPFATLLSPDVCQETTKIHQEAKNQPDLSASKDKTRGLDDVFGEFVSSDMATGLLTGNYGHDLSPCPETKNTQADSSADPTASTVDEWGESTDFKHSNTALSPYLCLETEKNPLEALSDQNKVNGKVWNGMLSNSTTRVGKCGEFTKSTHCNTILKPDVCPDMSVSLWPTNNKEDTGDVTKATTDGKLSKVIQSPDVLALSKGTLSLSDALDNTVDPVKEAHDGLKGETDDRIYHSQEDPTETSHLNVSVDLGVFDESNFQDVSLLGDEVDMATIKKDVAVNTSSSTSSWHSQLQHDDHLPSKPPSHPRLNTRSRSKPSLPSLKSSATQITQTRLLLSETEVRFLPIHADSHQNPDIASASDAGCAGTFRKNVVCKSVSEDSHWSTDKYSVFMERPPQCQYVYRLFGRPKSKYSVSHGAGAIDQDIIIAKCEERGHKTGLTPDSREDPDLDTGERTDSSPPIEAKGNNFRYGMGAKKHKYIRGVCFSWRRSARNMARQLGRHMHGVFVSITTCSASSGSQRENSEDSDDLVNERLTTSKDDRHGDTTTEHTQL